MTVKKSQYLKMEILYFSRLSKRERNMKVTILALHLGYGGIEKYIITVANILCEEHDVEILTTYKIIEKPAFSIDKRVKIKYLSEGVFPNSKEFKNALNKKNLLLIVKEGMRSLKILHLKNKINRNSIKKCDNDIIISTREYHNKMIRKYAKDKIVKIATEHNHPCGNEGYIRKVLSSCRGFDYFLPISRELAEFYTKKFANTNTQVKYIPFCIEESSISVKPSFELPVYISVGRLSPEKGTVDLINVFEKILINQPNALLHIVGDGILMPLIKSIINEKKLNDNIIIHGFLNKKDIEQLYCQSSIFLMTSITESFGFVLLEAMSCGLPCIAFDSAQGANEIIENERNGYLIANRDPDLFAKKAVQLSNNYEKLVEMSLYSKKSLKKYSYENTKNQWLNFMHDIENIDI